MRYLAIKEDSIENGPGIRVSVFFSGCLPNKCKYGNCPGCHNPEAQKFNVCEEYTEATKQAILKAVSSPYIKGLTLVGGEPYDQDMELITELCQEVKALNKDIWVYTGYEFDQIKDKELSKYVDVAVVGPFILEQRDISDANRWRGSRNQKVINMPESLKTGKISMLAGIPNNE
jgi:anaerobic ribonucleoside-triphosphate reductase activating protein